MSLPKCTSCGMKTDVRDKESGLCRNCVAEKQNEENRRAIVNTSMPNGVITRWNDTPSFLSKKSNSMYFKIPSKMQQYFDPDIKYEIIVKEVAIS